MYFVRHIHRCSTCAQIGISTDQDLAALSGHRIRFHALFSEDCQSDGVDADFAKCGRMVGGAAGVFIDDGDELGDRVFAIAYDMC